MGAYNDEVLFIHIPKTAGTSVKHYMYEHLPDVKWPHHSSQEMREESKLPIGHIPLRDIPMFLGRPVDSWEKIIAVIRNPYEHQVSQWWFWKGRYAQGDQHPHSVTAAQYPRIHGWLKDPMSDFHVWYQHRFHPEEPMVPKENGIGYEGYGGYYPYWLEVDGEVPPNVQILRAEELDHQFPLALAEYIDGPLPEMPHINQGSKIDWQKVLGAGGDVGQARESIAVINEKFRWCFEQGFYPTVEVKERGS